MKHAVVLLFIVFFSFGSLSNVYGAESLKTNPIIELLNIFLNFKSIVDSVSSDTTTNPEPSIYITSPGSTIPVDTFFPNPLPPISNNVTTVEKNSVLGCLDKQPMYKQAGAQTGLPWELLATIHYLEIGCGSGSLVSGRAIGENEPDIGSCSSADSGPGKPIPLPGGGCGFSSQLESAIYAGNHLKGKIGKAPETFEELIKALGRYNGIGNANCGRVSKYTNCPPFFENEDHIYPMNWFDARHDTMYVVYCADRQKCNPPKLYRKAGGLTVLRILGGKL